MTRAPAPEDPRTDDGAFPAAEVRVAFLIDAEGRPLFPKVVGSPDRRLRPATLQVLPDFRFTPPRRNGEPVAVRVVLPVQFDSSEKTTFELEMLQVPPRVLAAIDPVYPFNAKKAGVNGAVTLEFTITSEGKPRNIRVVDSTHDIFNDAAVAAIAQWRFSPGMVDRVAVNTLRVRQTITFTVSRR